MAAAVTTVSLLLASCGAPEKSAAAKSVGPIDPSAVLSVTTAAPFPNLDPALQPTIGAMMFTTLIYDRLTMVDKDDNLMPMLAESWQFTDDGRVLDMSLRPDVRFHDGAIADAEAVRVSIERSKNLDGSTVKGQLADIESVEVAGPLNVRFHLAEGRGAQLPGVFSTNAGMIMSPKALADPSFNPASDPGQAGSGPYVMSAFTPNEELSLKRSAEYWDPDAGLLGGIDFKRAPNATTRLNGVQTGVTDLTTVSSANDLLQADNLAQRGIINMNEVKYTGVLGIYLESTKGDLSSREARQAIAHAINPEDVNSLFSGTCTPYRQVHPEGSWPAVPDFEYGYEYDVAKSTRLAKEAGGVDFQLSFPAGTNVEQPAQLIQGSLAEAGIIADLNPVPNTESNTRYQAGDFQAMVTASLAPQVDPADTVSMYLLSGYHLAGDPSLIAPLAAAGANPSLTEDERADIYREIWQIMLDEVWFVPLCKITSGIIFGDNVLNADNIPWASQGIHDLRYIAMSN